jgi:hypothetical protein
MAGGQH